MNEPNRGPNWPFPRPGQTSEPRPRNAAEQELDAQLAEALKPMREQEDRDFIKSMTASTEDEDALKGESTAMKNQGLGTFPTATFTHVPKVKPGLDPEGERAMFEDAQDPGSEPTDDEEQ